MKNKTKLYKYVTAEGIDILQNLRVLVQNPNNFNDPFEFTAGVEDLSERKFIKFFKKGYAEKLYQKYGRQFPDSSCDNFKKRVLSDRLMVKELCKSLPNSIHEEFFRFKQKFGAEVGGVICFSNECRSKDNEILLWSHYAASHSGLRVFFDIEKIKLRSISIDKVNYFSKRIVLGPLYPRSNLEATEKIYEELLFRKSIVWKYEEEYRWLISYQECFSEHDAGGKKKHYITIDPKAILCVDLGLCASEDLEKSVQNCLKAAHFSHVILRKSEIDRKAFSLNYREIRDSGNT